MNRIAKFEKVSYEQFKRDWIDTFNYKYREWDEEEIDKVVHDIYESIQLPKRATIASAGYDFYSPTYLTMPIGRTIKIPTGIRCKMNDGWVLKCYPRSGHGFKYGVHLANTVGIIDGDYYNANNEGHIFIKLVNDSNLAGNIEIKKDEAFCQGIFLSYGVTFDDEVTEVRTGGLGSTSK